jgi:hypothetical protein
MSHESNISKMPHGFGMALALELQGMPSLRKASGQLYTVSSGHWSCNKLASARAASKQVSIAK